jgi:uroporphyrinogen decarboxylase
MTPKERVLAALHHQPTDVLPMLEPWVETDMVSALGCTEAPSAYVDLGLDGILIPTRTPESSNAWKDGVDEWGRRWSAGTYAGGLLHTREDLARYSPPVSYAGRFFDHGHVADIRRRYPLHCLFYGSHIGPFTGAALSMGYDRFLGSLLDEPDLAVDLLAVRADWCVAMLKEAEAAGVDLLILGDDAADNRGPMMSPRMWKEFVLPLHRRIVREMDVPVLWHSDGNIEPLLSMAVEAGFAGVHGLDPGSGLQLGRVTSTFGGRLAFAGNVNLQVLYGDRPEGVQDEVRRCLDQGPGGGSYLFATCNSICKGMNPSLVRAMYRLARADG